MYQPEPIEQNFEQNLNRNSRWSIIRSWKRGECRKRVERRKRRSGAVTVVVALSSVALLGFAALATDYGLMVAKRNHLQRACDAAALAGAADLPVTATAQYQAQMAARSNKVYSPTITYPNGLKQIGVEASETMNFFFARAIGIQSGRVATRAVAERVPLKGIPGVVPLAITVNDYTTHKESGSFWEVLIDNNRQDFVDGTITGLDLRNDNSGKAVDGFQEDLRNGTDNTVILGSQINSALSASLTSQGAALEEAMTDRFEAAAGAPWYDNGTNYTFPNYPSGDPRIITIMVADPNPTDNSSPLLNARFFAPVYVDRVTVTRVTGQLETRLRFRILPGRQYSTEDPGVVLGDPADPDTGAPGTPDTGIFAIRLIK